MAECPDIVIKVKAECSSELSDELKKYINEQVQRVKLDAVAELDTDLLAQALKAWITKHLTEISHLEAIDLWTAFYTLSDRPPKKED